MGNANVKLTEEEKRLKNATAPAGAMTAPTETSAQLYEQYAGRQPFSYDINSDALYEQYANQYANAGRLAMEDTLGKAAAMTGGYASSYAQTAGQQTLNAYISELNNMVPQLEQKAYDRYMAEGDDLLTRYSMALDRERTAIEDQRYEEETAYNRGQDEIRNEQIQQQMAISRAELRHRIDQDAKELEYKYADLDKSSGGSGGSGGGNSGSGNDTSDNHAGETYQANYSNWDAGDWEGYFAYIRQKEGQAAAEEEMRYMIQNALLPKGYVAAAAAGARGHSGGH